MKKVAVVNSHPIQYFAPLYARIEKSACFDLTVFYLSDFSLRGAFDAGFDRPVKWDIDLLRGYSSVFVGRSYQKATPSSLKNSVIPGLFWHLVKGRFDAVVIHGYRPFYNITAIIAAKLVGAKVLYRSDTNIVLERKRKRKIRDFCAKVVLRRCDALLAIGKNNADYYSWMGVRPGKIVLAPFAVDNDRFARARNSRREDHDATRLKFGISLDRPVVVFASKLIRRKGPQIVLEAVHKLNREGSDVELVVVGTGEMEAELRLQANTFAHLRVTFTGFVNQSELPSLLACCDVLAFPTKDEPWGLIVNEAMAAGLPVVVGDDAGCVPDLVKDGVNGFVVRPDDVEALKVALAKIVNDPKLKNEMAEASARIIERWTFSECISGWQRGLER
ncbi:glycosyltransferase family 4 protein [Mesorhizobium sp. M0923]|uniref:glycosyltransferase family 4 protein n=1 Tax=Mesorhizobium sp. M0923 TaxID=2957028 RepID=UPI0033395036